MHGFVGVIDIPVVFERDKSNRIIGYKTDGQVFKLITSDIEKSEMFPRKELYHNPNNYVYHEPNQTGDCIRTNIFCCANAKTGTNRKKASRYR